MQLAFKSHTVQQSPTHSRSYSEKYVFVALSPYTSQGTALAHWEKGMVPILFQSRTGELNSCLTDYYLDSSELGSNFCFHPHSHCVASD